MTSTALPDSSAEISGQAAQRLIDEGNALEDQGRFQDALEQYESALRLTPALARAHLNRGNALLALGDAEAAAGAYATALALDPLYAAAHYNLGNANICLNRRQEALAAYRRALELKPDFADAHVALGALLEDLGQLADAAASYGRALQAEPAYAAVHGNLGNVLLGLRQTAAAIASYRRALELDPQLDRARYGLAAAHYELGNELKDLDRTDDAIASYRDAIRFDPGHVNAHCMLGNVLFDQGRLDAAATCFRRALDLKPDFPEAWNNLGAVLKSKGPLEEAIACYEAAIRLRPNFPEAHFHLGNALLDQDRVDEALGCYRHAVSLRPEYAEARWSIVAAQIPAVYGIDADPALHRRAFSAELDKLIEWFAAERTMADPGCVRIQTPFYLAYQEEDNRELRLRHGSLCTRMMEQWLARQSLPARERRNSGGVIRIGIVSRHFCKHSVWSAIIKGWFEQLDRKRFSLHAFYLGSARDQETLFAQSRAACFEQGSRGLREWVEAISGQQPDVLIYPEIGMDSMTGQLACLRLAPVQVATWGHPETTGLPNIDYYLSAECLEPESAQESYSERLVKLPGLGCHYDLYEVDAVTPDLGRWGIEPGTPVLLCPGTPFKYAPQRDWILAEIARRLGRCRLVFFTYAGSPHMSEKLRQRLRVEFGRRQVDFDDVATFIPWQTWQGFFGWLQRADIYLDTIGFSGFNTAMQAVECGLPIVTRAGRLLRGRLASGILEHIDLRELVAQSDDDYIDLAVRLGRDTAYRMHVRDRMAASRHLLYRDTAPIRALEDFFVMAASDATIRTRVRDGDF